MRGSCRLLTPLVSTLLLTAGTVFTAAPSAAAASPGGRYVVVARSAGDFAQLRADAVASGSKIVLENPDLSTFVVQAPAGATSKLASDPHAAGVAPDRIVELIDPEQSASGLTASGPRGRHVTVKAPSTKTHFTADPANALKGLMWNFGRIRATDAWRVTTGDKQVTVGVADTGLDFTHVELASKVTQVVDLSDPAVCRDEFELPVGDGSPFPSAHMSDFDLAALFGGPATTDWNGHGSWIGATIAGAANGTGVNGIGPSIGLVSLKISGWCGAAYDSTILDAFTWAAKHKVDVVSISFGGYLDLSDPAQKLIYDQYVKAVQFAAKKGTVIVASAGNEHVRIGDGGKVISHGYLNVPGDPPLDLFGYYQTPGGIPGVVMVSATGNFVAASSNSCDPALVNDNADCKPKSDPHQQTGVGRLNQLAYYSNYGPRIDVAAPGGARKFNLPRWDTGGTPGFPVTDATGYVAYQDFSATSDWALEIPCYTTADGLPTSAFPANECYSTIQGTSMATPHASAVVALMASRYPWARHHTETLVWMLKVSARNPGRNTTQPLSATDLTPGDLGGPACTSGYCHLGGPAISDRDAYGAGLVDAYTAVTLWR